MVASGATAIKLELCRRSTSELLSVLSSPFDEGGAKGTGRARRQHVVSDARNAFSGPQNVRLYLYPRLHPCLRSRRHPFPSPLLCVLWLLNSASFTPCTFPPLAIFLSEMLTYRLQATAGETCRPVSLDGRTNGNGGERWRTQGGREEGRGERRNELFASQFS